MEKRKIVVCDHIHEKGLKILESQSDIIYVNVANEPKDKLPELIEDADVIITRSSTDVDEKLLVKVKKLKAIVRAGVGVDNIDIKECSKRGIIVMNVPTANTIAAVELTMAHLLNCVRAFPYAHSELKDKRVWKRENWYGTELKDKKLGIIGFGNIGSRVGIRAKSFEMDVIAYDPYVPSNKATDLGIKYTTNFDDILACDIITIHTPKNKETLNIINYEQIEKMKDGVILINCARGGLYNEDAIFDGLKSGKIKFAGMDVFNKEPATNNPLLDLNNICVTPHLGANTKESQFKIAIAAAEQAIEAAKGISYPNALNLPIKENEIPPFVKPYLELVQKVGYFAAQANKGAITSIKISAEGAISDYLESLLTFATVGALTDSIGDNINYVNAVYVAGERGIKLETLKSPNQSGYQNKISVKVTTPKDVVTISGTVFDEDKLRIVNLNGFILDVEPKGNMILFKNSDVPGVIGDVGMTLAKHNINIADFRLGRNSNNEALAVIIVDEPVDNEVLKELANLKACLSVHHVVV
ncbi:MAG: phosphoglycerate dehydrogenase [Campylobacterales bacterium]|nr:phosphoglycerate dehydrogenase [Campylobacterales bacterium]